jgi:deazaflavin-dependent oxidoreductase (nitroreductase family)
MTAVPMNRPAIPSATRLRRLAPLTTHIFNPVMRLLAGWAPGLGVLTHRGRHTGRMYRSPLLVLQRGEEYVVALWYGSDAQWVRNVLAAGGGRLNRRGREIRLVRPELFADANATVLPGPLRFGARLLRVTEFLRFHADLTERSPQVVRRLV